jgi:hypothetical protein
MPVLVDERGPLFGTENICRELVRRSEVRSSVVMRGETSDRVVANAEELTLHVMSSEVSLIVAGEERLPPKVRRSIETSLTYLDQHIDALLAALPPSRTFSFVEVALFSVVTHLPFRNVMDVAPWGRLVDFSNRFGTRESARATEYRFDVPG